jgi:hypothetical protein
MNFVKIDFEDMSMPQHHQIVIAWKFPQLIASNLGYTMAIKQSLPHINAGWCSKPMEWFKLM